MSQLIVYLAQWTAVHNIHEVCSSTRDSAWLFATVTVALCIRCVQIVPVGKFWATGGQRAVREACVEYGRSERARRRLGEPRGRRGP